MSNFRASVAKYGDKYRVYYSFISPIDGKRHRTCKRGFSLKRDADKWIRDELPKMIMELEHETKSDELLTFAELAAIYQRDTALRLRETTNFTKQYIIDKKILPFFANKLVYSITAKDIRDWHSNILSMTNKNGERYSDTYLRAIDNQMTAIINYAVRYHGLPVNPMLKAEKIGCKEGSERKFWEVEEYLKFRDAIADKPMFYYAFEVLFWCGLRLGELQALTVEDMDFEKKTLRVDESYARIHQVDIINAPKTASGKRTIAIHDDLADELQEYISSLYEADKNTRIFPVSKYAFHREMKRGCKISGVKEITIHGLRHSHISMLMEMGVPAAAIAPRVGQKRTSMTMHYAHPYAKRDREIAENINGIAGKQHV